jgi:hypothetical protein
MAAQHGEAARRFTFTLSPSCQAEPEGRERSGLQPDTALGRDSCFRCSFTGASYWGFPAIHTASNQHFVICASNAARNRHQGAGHLGGPRLYRPAGRAESGGAIDPGVVAAFPSRRHPARADTRNGGALSAGPSTLCTPGHPKPGVFHAPRAKKMGRRRETTSSACTDRSTPAAVPPRGQCQRLDNHFSSSSAMMVVATISRAIQTYSMNQTFPFGELLGPSRASLTREFTGRRWRLRAMFPRFSQGFMLLKRLPERIG